jgi:hypothetical protein
MNEILAVLLVLLLASSGYAAGRMHGQYSYHVGYRFGYRHGYYDGDRASWNRRRRELQNAVASVLKEPAAADLDDLGPPDRSGGTTYASSAAYGEDEPAAGTVAEQVAEQMAEQLELTDAEVTDPEPELPEVAGEGGRHSAAGSAAGSRFLADAGR